AGRHREAGVGPRFQLGRLVGLVRVPDAHSHSGQDGGGQSRGDPTITAVHANPSGAEGNDTRSLDQLRTPAAGGTRGGLNVEAQQPAHGTCARPRTAAFAWPVCCSTLFGGISCLKWTPRSFPLRLAFVYLAMVP